MFPTSVSHMSCSAISGDGNYDGERNGNAIIIIMHTNAVGWALYRMRLSLNTLQRRLATPSIDPSWLSANVGTAVNV
jgi:hypothetical protein